MRVVSVVSVVSSLPSSRGDLDYEYVFTRQRGANTAHTRSNPNPNPNTIGVTLPMRCVRRCTHTRTHTHTHAHTSRHSEDYECVATLPSTYIYIYIRSPRSSWVATLRSSPSKRARSTSSACRPSRNLVVIPPPMAHAARPRTANAKYYLVVQ